MLVKLTDIKAGDVWINPIYVKAVTQKRRHAEVHISYGGPFSSKTSVKVDQPAEEVALAISAAMPDSAQYIAAVAQQEEDEQARQQAAAAAAG